MPIFNEKRNRAKFQDERTKFESLAKIIENLPYKKVCMSGLTFPPVLMFFPSVEDPNFAFTNKVPSRSALGVSFPSRISCFNSCTVFGEFSEPGSGFRQAPAIPAIGLG